MNRKSAAAAVIFIGASVLTPLAGSAAAKGSYDPNVARLANPANVCKSIPGSIEHAAEEPGMPTPDLSWFDYDDCVRTMAHGDAFVEPAEVFGSPYVQCDRLQEFGLTLPHTFHDTDNMEDQLLPDLVAKNRKQCGNALYAFHAIFTALFPGGPPEGE